MLFGKGKSCQTFAAFSKMYSRYRGKRNFKYIKYIVVNFANLIWQLERCKEKNYTFRDVMRIEAKFNKDLWMSKLSFILFDNQ